MKVQKGNWEEMEKYANLYIGYHTQCYALANYLHVFLALNDGKRIDKRLQTRLEAYGKDPKNFKFTYPLNKLWIEGLFDKKLGQFYLSVNWLPYAALSARSFGEGWVYKDANRWSYMEKGVQSIPLNVRVFLGYEPVINLQKIETEHSPHNLDTMYHSRAADFFRDQIDQLRGDVMNWNAYIDSLEFLQEEMKKKVPSNDLYHVGILRFLESRD
jgi:hypothetical protein